MLVSMEWLSHYVNLDGIEAEEMAEKLTQGGVEVDHIHVRDTGIEGVVVGYVVEAEQHPNADKLKVCRVDVGEPEPVEIVCGAPNVAAGQKVPVAKVGAVLPGLKIKKAKLRGVVSHGMICSASELGLATKVSEGILVLPEELDIGLDVKDVFGLDDKVLELDLTPNRSDCLSMIGVAYELAALFNRELTLPKLEQRTGSTDLQAQVQLDAEEDCPFYALQAVKNITIGPSPQWMQNRLTAAGVRPINNIVDITNYVMLEYGQPLHAFDYDHVQDGTIVVRYAQKGETFVTLDDVQRTLDEEMMLITDGTKPVAIAGVMGGANSEISDGTQTVLIESAYFSPRSVSKTSRKLGLRSEASARFEKDVDPERILPALRRAASLMCELAGGELASEETVAQTATRKPLTVQIRYEQTNRLLGMQIPVPEVKTVFDRLRFSYKEEADHLQVTVPTRRPDISLEVDLIEEVARLYGYDKIPFTLPKGESTAGALTEAQSLKRRLRRTLQGLGLTEVVTYAFTTAEKNEQIVNLQSGQYPVHLMMPMSEERSVLRTGLLPSLIEVAGYNRHQREERIAIYEIGRTFSTDDRELKELPYEEEVFAGLLCGPFLSPDWLDKDKPLDFFAVKGLLEAVFRRLGVTGITYVQTQPVGFHPGRTAEIRLNDQTIGIVGELHPQLASRYDLPDSYGFQMKLQPILAAACKHDIRFQPLPRYPAVTRDLAIVVDEAVPVSALTDTIRRQTDLLEQVSVFDVFIGEKIGKGRKSVAFSLVYRDPERTLTDEEINERHEQIIQQLSEKHRAELRR